MGDTIAAIATARGEAGVAIVRISGPQAQRILGECFQAARGNVAPGRLCYGHVVDGQGEAMDEAMGVLMKGPASYTREDVAEIQCHGGEVNAQRVLRRVLEAGARLAEPGEFTRRAFENGRMDLSQAEAVMALVGAKGQAAARAAVRQMSGGVSQLVEEAAKGILDMLSLIEAGNDFPEEVEEQAARDQLLRDIRQVYRALQRAGDPTRARLVRSGAVAVLCGRPNTGKSSLMNALLEYQRAIVTNQPGTTRDTLTETMEVEGLPVALTDTAGQRDCADQAERIGVDRARQAEEQADLVLLVLDGSQSAQPEDLDMISRADQRYLAVINKCDRPLVFDVNLVKHLERVSTCALNGAGMDQLRAAIRRRLSGAASEEALITGERQLALCAQALQRLESARTGLEAGFPADVAAVDLQGALEALWSITGKNARESVIDQVFSRFCVGK